MRIGKVHFHPAQRGIVLLDALIAIVIFAIGILGMVKLQANAVNFSSDAKYRTDAAMLADQVIGQMWNADPATLGTVYASPAGTSYLIWNNLVATLPGGTGAIVFGANNAVTVTVTWQPPNDTDPAPHRYVSATQIIH
ncbi:hypothetical protein [Dokdonella soli]